MSVHSVEKHNALVYLIIIIKGDNECAICMQGYVVNEKIITLTCSEKHHFHSDCIISWLQVNNKCPLCRVVALENQ